MYNPERFKNIDTDAAFNLMFKFPFATVVTANESASFISHLPLTPIYEDGKIILVGHMAKANPHWKLMKDAFITSIFHGHHTYITPMWYAENDVPTWNYSVVHANGTAQLYEKYDDLIDCLKVLTSHVETNWPSGWEFFVPDDLPKEVLEKSIVGFKIKVDELSYKAKLSQNRTDADRSGVLSGLQGRADEQSLGVLQDMKKFYSADGKKK